jgi:hypothetical protein
MDESQGTGLLNLPNELLDRIISFLAPKPEDRYVPVGLPTTQ